VAVASIHSACGAEKESVLTDYQKALRGLENNEIHAGLSTKKLFGMCTPNWRTTAGRFTVYTYESLPGYHGLEIITKDGRLKRATEWSCTYSRVYFNELTLEDKKEYEKCRKENENVPDERITAHGGWERPRMRDWMREEAKPGGASQK
jgi:hypothetical protein